MLDIITSENDGTIKEEKAECLEEEKRALGVAAVKEEKRALRVDVVFKEQEQQRVSALVAQHSEDWQMKVTARFMGVRNKKEELLDPPYDPSAT
jgi:hypothetical protein